MAKLGGDRVKLEDIRTPFATSPGGRVIDLSQGLDFYIRTRGTSSISDVVEEVSNTILTLSGALEFNRNSRTTYGPPSFLAHNGFEVVLNDPNKYPSYLKDEQTVVIMFRNMITGSSTDSWSYPSPRISSLPVRAKYLRLEDVYPSVNGYASGSLMWKDGLLFTSSSYTTGSYEVECMPFLVAAASTLIADPSDDASTRLDNVT